MRVRIGTGRESNSRAIVASPRSASQRPGRADSLVFPASLLLGEQKYEAALNAGDDAGIEEARVAFASGLNSLREADLRRLQVLDAQPGHQSERAFLRARGEALSARLASLANDGGDADGAAMLVASRPAPAAPPRPAPAASPKPAPAPARDTARVQPPPPAPALEPEAPLEPAPEKAHRNDIQGLRAVAVLLVAFSHAGVAFLAGGYVGVDVFFVLSGFLITGLLLSEARRRRFVSMGDFYLRRMRRILPAAMLTLLVTDFASVHLLNFIRAKQYVLDSIPSALFVANIHFAAQGTDYFAQSQPPSPFQHFWSLAVEEQFYVVWPALFALVLGLSLRRFAPRPAEVRRRAVRRALIVIGAIAVASLAWSISYTNSNAAAAYFSTLTRVWELGMGAALAVGAARFAGLSDRWRTVMGWAGLALIALAAVSFSSTTAFPGYAALEPTIGAALLIAAGIGRSPRRSANRVLSVRPMRYVGDRSYTFYLWHWPVLVIAAQYVGHNLSVGTNLLLLVGAFALSIVTYALFEKPIRNAQWARKPAAALAFALSVLLVVAFATSRVSSIDTREELAQVRAQNASVLALAPTPAATTKAASPSTTTASAAPPGVLPAVAAAVTSPPRGHVNPDALSPPISDLQNAPYLPNSNQCITHFGQTSSPSICRLGNTNSSRTIVVIGDSHAEMWMPAIDDFARLDGWTVIPLIKLGCLASEWTTGEHAGAGKGAAGLNECHTWYRWAMAQVRSLHPDVALVTGYYSYVGPAGDQYVVDGLQAAADSVKSNAKRVVIIGDPPTRANDPTNCLLARGATYAGCTRPLNQYEISITGQVSQMAVSNRFGFIDTTPWFCYQGQCPVVIGGIITYRDDNHVSAAYSSALSAAFRAGFNAEVRPTKRS